MRSIRGGGSLQEESWDRIKQIRDKDRIMHLFGMELEEAADGYVRVSATVGEDALNFHDIAHGALIFALADVAFAFVVNAQIDAVGVQWNMNLFRSAALGDKISAECRLVHGGRRVMVVEFTVKGREDKVLARGQATAMPV